MVLAAERICRDEPQLDELGTRLAELRGALEGRFLAAGEALSDAVGGIDKLIAGLDNLRAALDDGTTEATISDLNASGADLLRLPEGHAGRHEGIEQLIKAHGGLTECVGEMHRNLSYLRVFAVNIRIAAAGIPAATDEFANFSNEIGAGIERAGAELGALGRELGELEAELNAARQRQRQLSGLCARLLPAIPNALRADAEALAAQHERIAEVAASIRVLAENVQKKVGAALMALQIGDITRQRLEHVEAGLEMIHAAGASLAPEQHARLRAAVGQVLAAQLRATAADFGHEAGRIAENFGGIALIARDMSKLGEVAEGRKAGEERGALRNLEGDVRRALDLVRDMEQGDRAARALAETAAAMARRLSRRIDGLQAIRKNVQQMALNCTLKSNRIGDGAKPLTIISVELRQYAGQLETLGARALAMIESLVGHADRLAVLSGEEQGSGIGDALEGASERIRTASEEIEASVTAANAMGNAVIANLTGALARADLQGQLVLDLEQLAAALEAEADGAEPFPADIAERTAQLLDRLARLYTMAHEREVHREWMARLALPGLASDGERTATEPADVLF